MVFDLLIAVPAAAVAVAWRAWPDLLIFIGPSFAIILDLVVEADAGVHREAERDAVQERDERKEGRNMLTGKVFPVPTTFGVPRTPKRQGENKKY